MQSNEWSLSAAFEVIAAAAPDRDALVLKDTRRPYAQGIARIRSLAGFLQRRGLGVRRERADLPPRARGPATVARLLHNCPGYIETMLARFRPRPAPFQV